MVIKFVPRAEEEIPLARKISAFLVLLIFFGVTFLSFAFLYGTKKTEEGLKIVEEKISQGKTKERLSLEKEIKLTKERIDNYSEILKGHLFPSKIFSLLEENTDPNIFFNSFTFKEESMRVDLQGEAKDLPSLQREISLLREKEEIINPTLSDVRISLTNEGKRKIDFSLSFILKKSFLEK